MIANRTSWAGTSRMWLNVTYNIPNFCRTKFKQDRAIGPTLCNHKWALIWCFMFVSRIII